MFFKKKPKHKPRRPMTEAQVGDFVRCYAGANQEFEIVCLVMCLHHWGGVKIQCVYSDHPSWKAGYTVVTSNPWDRNWTIVEGK